MKSAFSLKTNSNAGKERDKRYINSGRDYFDGDISVKCKLSSKFILKKFGYFLTHFIYRQIHY